MLLEQIAKIFAPQVQAGKESYKSDPTFPDISQSYKQYLNHGDNVTWIEYPDHLTSGELKSELDAKRETHKSNEQSSASPVHRRRHNRGSLKSNVRIGDVYLQQTNRGKQNGLQCSLEWW